MIIDFTKPFNRYISPNGKCTILSGNYSAYINFDTPSYLMLDNACIKGIDKLIYHIDEYERRNKEIPTMLDMVVEYASLGYWRDLVWYTRGNPDHYFNLWNSTSYTTFIQLAVFDYKVRINQYA